MSAAHLRGPQVSHVPRPDGYRHGCDGKVPLLPELADTIAKRMTQRSGVPAHPYRCPHCRAWHVTSDRTRQ